MNYLKKNWPLGALAMFAACTSQDKADDLAKYKDGEVVRELASDDDDAVEASDRASVKVKNKTFGRGSPAEFDTGPSKNSGWAELFASNPNYRAVGTSIIGGSGEKFRWHFGPMFYRGRLTPNSVKVFVIGQEGAQDESLSNRSFTGSTGGKMQNILEWAGITESYLFMNTFVYTIHGQYTVEGDEAATQRIRDIAQNLNSPIVIHRHKMFDKVAEDNKDTLALVIGVGAAGRDTLQTWVKSRGGKCSNVNTSCDGSVLGKGVQVMAVPHPGAANPNYGGAGAMNNLNIQFEKSARKIEEWEKTIKVAGRSSWLPADHNGKRFGAFRYRSIPVPLADFPYAANWRLGFGSTSSNRNDRQQSIQLFSAGGCYGAVKKDARGKCPRISESDLDNGTLPSKERLSYKKPKDMATSIPGFPEGDVEWESPRKEATAFDPGPSKKFAGLLMGEEEGFEYPNFNDLGVTQHPSFGFQGPYRGRLESAKILVIADQESNDDLFTTRALTGEGGQRLQAFLRQSGVGLNYAILKTIPVDTSDLSDADVVRIALNDDLVRVRQEAVKRVLATGKTQAVVVVGPGASAAAKGIDFGKIPVVELVSPKGNYAADWSKGLEKLKEAGFELRSTTHKAELLPIPREDLPIHTKWWAGTSGTRSSRAFNIEKQSLDPNYYKFYMPDWVYRLRAKPLSAEEQEQIQRVKSGS